MFLSVFAVSCEEVDETFDIEGTAGNPYVRILPNADTVVVNEGGTYALILTVSHSVRENVSVNYDLTLMNGAELGEDIVLANNSGNSGVLVIPHLSETTVTDRDTLFFRFPTDGVPDGDKRVRFEITGASTASDQAIDFGAPGQKKFIYFKIIDVDCPSDLDGTYNSGNNCFAGDASIPTWVKVPDTNADYQVSDFTGGYYAFAGVPQIPALITEACGSVAAEDFAFSVLRFTNMSGVVNQNGSITLKWTESTGFGNGGTPVTCTTTWQPQ